MIEPTRDLAQQTFNVFEEFMERVDSEECRTQAALLVGGVKPNKTLRLLEQDKVDVLVGTPPIIASYMKKGAISPSRCRFFCLDEADELITSDYGQALKFSIDQVLIFCRTNLDCDLMEKFFRGQGAGGPNVESWLGCGPWKSDKQVSRILSRARPAS